MKRKNHEIITLTIFKDWHEIAKKYNLSDEQYGAVIRAMCEYCFYDKDTELELPQGMIFDMAKPYIRKSNQNKIDGHNGGIKYPSKQPHLPLRENLK